MARKPQTHLIESNFFIRCKQTVHCGRFGDIRIERSIYGQDMLQFSTCEILKLDESKLVGTSRISSIGWPPPVTL